MILHSLKEYYDRKSFDPDSGIAPFGWERKEIPYIIVLDEEGIPINLENTQEGTGKNKQVKAFIVPLGVKRTAGVAANLLWDNTEYVLGMEVYREKGAEDFTILPSEKKFAAFFEKLQLPEENTDEELLAVQRFCARSLEEKCQMLQDFDSWQVFLHDAMKSKPNVTFRLRGKKRLVCQSQAIKDYLGDCQKQPKETSLCLVTGEKEQIARTHTAIKGVWGGNTSGTNIVGFNLVPFESYGKKQGDNAPVGEPAMFAYTTALNTLLRKGSTNRMQVGEASTVFWSERGCQLEDNFQNYIDDPDSNTDAVKALLKAPETGSLHEDDRNQRFYVLGLSPNAARLAIRFWIVSTVREMEGHIRQHFLDTQIAHGPKQSEYLSIFRLLVSVAAAGKSENIPPNLEGDVMRAILEGLPYPQTLFRGALLRNQAEQNVTYPRAAIIKAYLNRKIRLTPTQEELKMTVDFENKTIGYRLGRLFSTLERIQEVANPGINATIRDRFYGSASGTPISVFPNLMRLKNHHLAKLEKTTYFEMLLGEIMSVIKAFPSHLSLIEQGNFAVGYYHQRQEFFTKKEGDENTKASESE